MAEIDSSQLDQDLVRRVQRGDMAAFELLVRAGRLSPELATTLKRMVGFRNVAVHEYQRLNLAIVQAIIETHLQDLRAFARLAP